MSHIFAIFLCVCHKNKTKMLQKTFTGPQLIAASKKHGIENGLDRTILIERNQQFLTYSVTTVTPNFSKALLSYRNDVIMHLCFITSPHIHRSWFWCSFSSRSYAQGTVDNIRQYLTTLHFLRGEKTPHICVHTAVAMDTEYYWDPFYRMYLFVVSCGHGAKQT